MQEGRTKIVKGTGPRLRGPRATLAFDGVAALVADPRSRG